MSRPTITFSFRPRRSSFLPMIAASVSTRVVSWNDAAEMNESVDSDALVMPSSMCSYVAPLLALLGRRPCRSRPADPSARPARPVMKRVSPGILHLHAAQHLPHDHLDVLVVDLHALQPVDVLHLVGDVARERLDTRAAAGCRADPPGRRRSTRPCSPPARRARSRACPSGSDTRARRRRDR